jgi:Rhs element Vgr protein
MSPLIPSANATDLVTFKVLIAGQAVETLYAIRQIEVMREVNRVPSARLVIADGDPASQEFAASSSGHFVPGNEIEIRAGYHSQEEVIFKGIIIRQGIRSDVSRPPRLVVECRDKAFKMTIGRKNRTFAESTDSDVITIVLSEYSLDQDIESTSTTHESLVQYNASDWDFLVLRAESNGKVVLVQDGTVKVKGPSLAGAPVAELSYGAGLLGFDADIHSESQFSSVKSIGWSATDQQLLEMEGSDPGIAQPGNLSPADLAQVSGLDEYTLRHAGQLTDQSLQAWSDAVLLRSRLSRVRGRATVQGTASLNPGDLVTLSGLGDRFNGTAWISGVRHEIENGTWITNIGIGLEPESFAQKHQADLQAPPASGLTAGVHGLQPAVVVQLQDDPQGEARVKINLPLLNSGNESIWARISTLDAGSSRGTFFRPEIGDEVLVGFLNDDPNHPVILGMLHSSALAAPVEASDDNHEKGYVSRSGMKVWFNDDTKTIEISTPNGNSVFIDEDDAGIRMTDINGNKLKMSSDGIEMESVQDIILKATGDLKAEGVNIELSANAQFKAQGSGGAEVSSSAVTIIKGSMVQIN